MVVMVGYCNDGWIVVLAVVIVAVVIRKMCMLCYGILRSEYTQKY